MGETKGKAELLQRLMSDADFRARLFADPDGVVAEEGYTIDDETMEKLRSLDAEAAEAAIGQLGAEASREAAG